MNLVDEIKAFSSLPERISESLWQRHFLFPAEFIGFKGHFPNNPVLPAVIQIYMARLLWNQVIAPVDWLNVLSAKFKEPLRPGQRITLILDKSGSVELRAQDRLCSLLKVLPCFPEPA